MSNFKSRSSWFSTAISGTHGKAVLYFSGFIWQNWLFNVLLLLVKTLIAKWVITWKNSILNVRFFLLLVTDINVKFNEHVLMRARHSAKTSFSLSPPLSRSQIARVVAGRPIITFAQSSEEGMIELLCSTLLTRLNKALFRRKNCWLPRKWATKRNKQVIKYFRNSKKILALAPLPLLHHYQRL